MVIFHSYVSLREGIREVVALYVFFLMGLYIVMNQYQSLKLCVQTMPAFLVACFEKLRWQNVHFQRGRCSLQRNILKQQAPSRKIKFYDCFIVHYGNIR